MWCSHAAELFMCADFIYVIIHVVTKQLHGVLHTPAYLWSLALDGTLRRWSPVIKDVLSTSFVFMRGRNQRTWYVCRLWNQSNPSGSLQEEMNRIDQNGIWGELEFPQLLRADILNMGASLRKTRISCFVFHFSTGFTLITYSPVLPFTFMWVSSLSLSLCQSFTRTRSPD